ncbi:MAG: glycosyltransferase [Chroococcus sp. CMT-3BRIN-NPC107]|jgi:GT2 family glycosyltransferase|nr:glycosyltransferase [Chroococcus sp. CMT-3BRIN-NPC107]
MNNSIVSDPEVTIVVSPRERFNHTSQSLESIYSYTEFPFKLIYVDGGSPENIKRYLQQAAQDKGFELIRTDYYLSPNQARNIGLAQVKSKYVVFVDNDLEVTPGWLRKLVDCAEETNATVISPLICQGTPVHEIIHCAGGESGVRLENKEGNVKRRILEKIYKQGRRVAEVRDGLKREETGLAEFHCMLVRTSIFDKIGQLDEGMLNTKEHVDFCMTVIQTGEKVYLEPDSLVTYVPGPPLELSDMTFYMLRWSDAWELASLQNLRAKWDLTEDEYFKNKYKRLGWRRHMTLIDPLINRLSLGKNNSLWKKIVRKTLTTADKTFNKYITNHYDRNKPKVISRQRTSESMLSTPAQFKVPTN